MGRARQTRRSALAKRRLNPNDSRIRANQKREEEERKAREGTEAQGRRIVHAEKPASHLFFRYNMALGPPYRVLIDTNFINFSIQNKLDVFQAMLDCLLAKCIPIITDCVMAEIEKLGVRFRVALKIARDPRFQRSKCDHKGTYADDCIVKRVQQHNCFIVATCDKDLKRRIRRIPGVPIMFISNRKYAIERFADVSK